MEQKGGGDGTWSRCKVADIMQHYWLGEANVNVELFAGKVNTIHKNIGGSANMNGAEIRPRLRLERL